MAKIISFISRKGGTGKTTAAINLASMLHSIGHKVCLFETDTNYTLNTLRRLELHTSKANSDAIFQIFASDDASIVKEIKQVQKSMAPDYIIVDSAGKTTDENIKKLSVESDIVVVPTSLTQNDLLVTYQTIEDIKPAKDINKKLKILVLPNRVHSMTKLDTIKDALKTLDAEILDVKIPAKNSYANFSTILPEKEFLPIAQAIISQF
jgi:chromosome partitioning protein